MSQFCADAIVVLGGMVRADGSLTNALNRRVEKGAQAFHHGLAPFVVCSGGKSWNGHVEALRMRDRLLTLDVNPDCILTELSSHSTAENAWHCAKLFRERGWVQALVVSCFWHLPRASQNFQACGMKVSTLASDGPVLGLRSGLYRACAELLSRHLDLLRIRRWESL